MNIQLAFTNLERIESLEFAVTEKITSVLEKFGTESFTSCRVRLEKCNSQTHTHHVIYGCEVVVQSPRYTTIHIGKEAEDIHDAIHEVGEKLNNVLSREHRHEISRRHNTRIPSASEA